MQIQEAGNRHSHHTNTHKYTRSMGKLLQLALHPIELKAALKLKFCRTPLFSIYDQSTSPYLLHCFELLNLTSRSFAAVIRELHPELRNCVTLFYLILRALDTIEDDMSIEHDLKIDLLRHFHEKLLLTKWRFDGNAPDVKDRAVLTDFESILIEFHKLKPEYQDVIKEITEKMGNGMADYILDENYNLNGLQTVHDYDVYCHYVAGLVGDGLTRLIIIARFANESLYSNEQLYESMGLFLQKTNIIRDYNEDLVDGRSFWPKEIWSQYVPQLKDFMKPQDEQLGLDCINHLVLNALGHVIDVLTYLASIHEQSTFQFCAIPQVMAIATLALVFNNREVLHGNVKIRKGTTCYLILKSRSLRGCVEIFDYYLRDIKSKLAVQDPNFLKLNIQISKIEQFMEEMYQDKLPPNVKPNETPIFLKVKERSRYDDELVPTEQEEEYKFNMVLSIVLSILLGFYYIYTLHRQ